MSTARTIRAITRDMRSGAGGDDGWPDDPFEGVSRAPWTRLTSQRAKMCSRVIGRPPRRHKTQRGVPVVSFDAIGHSGRCSDT